MEIRDQRQREFADKWLENRNGILNLCPRFGKIFTSINIFEEMKPESILIAYPDEKIKHSWEEDFIKRDYSHENITFVTHLSLHKYIGEKFDLIVIDEIHLLSNAQIEACKKLFTNNWHVLGLTGTLSKWTEKLLARELSLRVEAVYPIEQAIKEGVICDYEISVIRVPLDDKISQGFGKKRCTEKRRYDNLKWVVNKLEKEGNDTFFMKLNRMRVIQKSLAKLNKTKQLIEEYKNDRILVFCGITAIADRLGIPSFHNKTKEEQIFTDFCEGSIPHLAVCKIGNTGVTYKPLNKVIVNYTSSDSEDLAQKLLRCMGMEYDNPDKKAHIYIISSTEDEEIGWIHSALEFFDKKKIKYIKQ